MRCPASSLSTKRLRHLPTAATRSAPFIRHRRRSHRSPPDYCGRHDDSLLLAMKIGNANTKKSPPNRVGIFLVLLWISPARSRPPLRISRRSWLWNFADPLIDIMITADLLRIGFRSAVNHYYIIFASVDIKTLQLGHFASFPTAFGKYFAHTFGSLRLHASLIEKRMDDSTVFTEAA